MSEYYFCDPRDFLQSRARPLRTQLISRQFNSLRMIRCIFRISCNLSSEILYIYRWFWIQILSEQNYIKNCVVLYMCYPVCKLIYYLNYIIHISNFSNIFNIIKNTHTNLCMQIFFALSLYNVFAIIKLK